MLLAKQHTTTTLLMLSRHSLPRVLLDMLHCSCCLLLVCIRTDDRPIVRSLSTTVLQPLPQFLRSTLFQIGGDRSRTILGPVQEDTVRVHRKEVVTFFERELGGLGVEEIDQGNCRARE